jgi:hypothetical protein
MATITSYTHWFNYDFLSYHTLILFCRDTKERRDREFERSEEKEIRIKQEPPDGKTEIY